MHSRRLIATWLIGFCSPNLLKSAGFAKHAVSITKQKDTEVRAAHANNDYDPGEHHQVASRSSCS